MSKKTSVYEFLQMEAVEGGLTKSDMAFFRKVCRWYSSTFHTPLHEVMECKVVQWDDILLHYYEGQMEELSFNNLFDIACQEYIPELAEEFEQENAEYAEALREEQERTVKKREERLAKKAKQNPQEIPQAKPPAPMKMNFEDEEV